MLGIDKEAQQQYMDSKQRQLSEMNSMETINNIIGKINFGDYGIQALTLSLPVTSLYHLSTLGKSFHNFSLSPILANRVKYGK